MNGENFNIQGDNGVGNNQPLNNNEFVQQPVISNQTNIPIQQPIVDNQINTTVQQPIVDNQTNTPIQKSNFNGGIKPKKKNSLFIIIRIILILIVVVVLIIFGSKLFLSSDNSNSDDLQSIGTNKSSKVSNSSIKDIYVDSDFVVALMENGDLNVIGDDGTNHFLGLGEDVDSVDKVTKVASNVKEIFYNASLEISDSFYIGNDNNLYQAGVRFDGGVYYEYNKIYTNIKSISYESLCLVALDQNNNMYGYGTSYALNFCGLKGNFDNFTLIKENILEIFSGSMYNGYITQDNELYMKSYKMDDYKLFLSNVKKISKNGNYFSKNFILLDNNELYNIQFDDNSVIYVNKLSDFVTDIDDDGLYFVKDNKYYVNIENQYIDKSTLETKSDIENYAYLNQDDIKKIVYSNPGDEYIYLNNNDEYILFNSEGKTNIGNSTDSIEKMYKFLNSDN